MSNYMESLVMKTSCQSLLSMKYPVELMTWFSRYQTIPTDLLTRTDGKMLADKNDNMQKNFRRKDTLSKCTADEV